MINKTYQIIHNKYLRFYKIFFFLKYIFSIFLLSILLFLLIPKFFNYEKKQEIIKEYLINKYDLKINNFSSIKFNILPLPNLSIENVNLNIKNEPIIINTNHLNIFLKFKNIYDYENFAATKVSFDSVKVDLDIESAKSLKNYLTKLEYNLDVKDLNLNFKKKENSVLNIYKIKFSNYGFKENKMEGKIFGKKFKAYLDEDNKNFDFKVLDTGIKAYFQFDQTKKENLISGSSKINILNNYLKLNFSLQDNQLKIMESKFKNQDLSLLFNSIITFDPFFGINSDININKIDKNLINTLKLEDILKNREIIKKFNSNNKINYNKKSFGNSLIRNYFSELSLSNGRLVFANKINMQGGIINCKGESLLTEEYPRLNFSCLFKINDKKKFFKNFSVTKNNQKPLSLDVEGSLNLINKKINFKKINIDNDLVAKDSDIKYFKETFENILFEDGFFNIFKRNKIKEFIRAII